MYISVTLTIRPSYHEYLSRVAFLYFCIKILLQTFPEESIYSCRGLDCPC